MTFPRQLSASADRPVTRSFFDRGLVPGVGKREGLANPLDRIGANGLRRSLTLEGVDRLAPASACHPPRSLLAKACAEQRRGLVDQGGIRILCKGRTDNGRRALCPPIRSASQGAKHVL